MSKLTSSSHNQFLTRTDEEERYDNDFPLTPADDGEEPPQHEIQPPDSEEQYIKALQSRFPSLPRSQYSYSKPNRAATPVPLLPPPTQTTTKTVNGGGLPSGTPNDRAIPRPALRRVDPEQQNTYAKHVANEMNSESSQSRPGNRNGTNVRFNDPNMQSYWGSSPSYSNQSGGFRTQDNRFDKVPSSGKPMSYLGISTCSEFEQCLRDCLERERCRLGMASHITRQHIPTSNPVRDYGCDQIVSAKATVQPQQPYSSSNLQYIDYCSRPAASMALDDIRYINVALSKSGISLFPFESNIPEPLPPPISPSSTTVHGIYPSATRSSGEVVSACRLIEEDSSLTFNKS